MTSHFTLSHHFDIAMEQNKRDAIIKTNDLILWWMNVSQNQ